LALIIFKTKTKYYNEVYLEVKEKLVSSIFPNRLIYENRNYRTNGEDKIIALLSEKFEDLGAVRNEKAPKNGGDSYVVPLIGLEPIQCCHC
jgi:site-specific DNA recombinase